MQITDIQIFAQPRHGDEEEQRFSANVAVDNKWLIQLGDTGEFSIPESNLAAWQDEEDQDYACENYDPDEIAKELKIPTDLESLRAMGGEDMI